MGLQNGHQLHVLVIQGYRSEFLSYGPAKNFCKTLRIYLATKFLFISSDVYSSVSGVANIATFPLASSKCAFWGAYTLEPSTAFLMGANKV